MIARTFDRALESAGKKWADMPTTGIELGAENKYSVNERKVIEGYLEAVDPKILEAAQMYRDDRNAKFGRYKLGDVQEREIREIKELLGIDVSGYSHSIDKNGFNHIEKRHGSDGEADRTMADLNDVARIGWVLGHFDSVERVVDKNGNPVYAKGYLDSEGNPAPVIVYRKKINGIFCVSEAVADGKWKKLWVTTAFMSENKKDASQTPNTSNEAPGYTSENESAAASDLSIIDTEQKVNSDAKFSLNNTSSIDSLTDENGKLDAPDGETVYARGKDYSDVMSKKEFKMFYDKVSEMKIGKEAQFHVSRDGQHIFDIENKLVYTDGDWYKPYIDRVVEFYFEDGTDMDAAKNLLVLNEDRGVDFEQTREILEDIYGKGCVALRLGEVRKADGRETGRGKGSAGRTLYSRNRGEVSVEEVISDAGLSVSDAGEIAYPAMQETMYSLRTLPETDYIKERDKAAAALAKRMGIEAKDAQRYIDNLTGVAAMIAADRARLDYEHESAYSAIKHNSDYKWTVDFSTLCKKRLLYTGRFIGSTARGRGECCDEKY